MNTNELKQHLISEYEQNFSGWDFSYLKGKMEEDPLPWNYRNIVLDHISSSQQMLDMGTGGGEFLDSLPTLPAKTYATEGYLPNIEIATKRLQPKGVEVKEVKEDDVLPFKDSFFDLVINRHESYSCQEVHRTLKNNGIFISQQVGGMNDIDVNSTLGAALPDFSDWCLLKAKEDLLHNGFEIVSCDEYIGKTRFYDIGSIVYYLKCIPWQVEDFTVEKYINRLFLLDDHIKTKGHKDFILHRFITIARKSK